MSKKIVIVGGVAGGASAAARLRRNDETAEIVIFEKGEYISFANCGLPYYIGGTIEKRSSLLLQTPESMMARFDLDIRIKSEVVSINRDRKTVTVLNHGNGETFEESYDKLILSPGSRPNRPNIKGIDSPNVFSLWNLPDTDAIKSYIDTVRPKTAVVVGGGFIGIEMMENLHDLGIEVTLVQSTDQVMAPIDKDMADILHRHIESKCERLILGDGVREFVYSEKNPSFMNPDVPSTKVMLASGAELDADIVIFSIGILPNSKIASDAGLEVGSRGGIVVNEKLLTSDPDIYAVGDVIEVEDYVTGQKTMKPLAGPANKQGRMVADIICGMDFSFGGVQGTSVAKVFDLTVANTGINEKQLADLGKKLHEDYEFALIHTKSHAGYYPGAMSLTLKLIFDMSGKVLGVQGVGYDGVEKRVDVIATAMRFGATVDDLTRLELSYAPPYSSAKDPVNMVGYTAQNILMRSVKVISNYELKAMMESGSSDFAIIDVRDAIERDMGFIEGSVNIPVNSLRDRLDELKTQYGPDMKLVISCAIGLRGYIASRILMQNGFTNVYNLQGGYTTWSSMDPKIAAEDMDIDEAGDPHSKTESEEEVMDMGEASGGKTFELNACGLQCPGPIAQVYRMIEMMECGDVLNVKATDAGFASDIGVWCRRTGNTLLKSGKEAKHFYASIMKGTSKTCPVSNTAIHMTSSESQKSPEESHTHHLPNGKTMVVFSGELDKAIASLIIANGAASMGREVTMFFTFWGLNILRKHEKVSVRKDFMSHMFGMMMPRGTKKLGLSKMNMGGMGARMIRGLMNKKNVDSLEMLLQSAKDSGVRLVACNMSMELMGITEDELIDGVDFAGVATYLGAAEESDVNLFI